MTTSEPPKVESGLPKKSASNAKLVNNRAAIFLMLFCVTGFLGIPVLYMSSSFTAKEKLVWSIVVTIYTCVLIGIVGYIIWYVYRLYVDLLV